MTIHPLDIGAGELPVGEPPEDDETTTSQASPTPTPPPTRSPEPVGGAKPTACQSERERVLRHPDIARRLTQPPLRYAEPDHWTGWIPPATWQGRSNDSPERKALLAIVTAAVEADKEAQCE